VPQPVVSLRSLRRFLSPKPPGQPIMTPFARRSALHMPAASRACAAVFPRSIQDAVKIFTCSDVAVIGMTGIILPVFSNGYDPSSSSNSYSAASTPD
jgi:hypothetical protein